MTDALRRRLDNWGRWARIDPCRPDDSCVNPIYDQYIPDGADEGWGEVTTATVRAIQTAPAKAEQDEIDEQDAETIDAWVIQSSPITRATLICHYVLRNRINWRELDPAVRALADLMDENRRVVARMEQR